MSDWIGRGGGRKASQPSLGEGTKYGFEEPSMGGKLDPAAKYDWKEPKAGGKIKSSLNWSGGDSRLGSAATTDPEGNYYFSLEIKGVEVAQFLECSGLKSTTEIFELQEGGMNHRVHKLPGQSRWENLQLRYGVTSDTSLLAWRNEVLSDDFGARRSGSIVVKNNQGDAVRRYSFVDAWPVSWEGPSLSASGAELAIEMIELAHSGISVQ